MKKESLLAPLEFRFTAEADIAQFGPGWHDYDEAAIVTQPARTLAALEAELGEKLVKVMNDFRQDGALGNLAATWLALRLERQRHGKPLIPFAEYSPTIMLTEWRVADQPDTEVPAVPLEQTTTADSATSPATE